MTASSTAVGHSGGVRLVAAVALAGPTRNCPVPVEISQTHTSGGVGFWI